MKLVAPNYYSAFRCKAGACRHSCCIGWEIDIDDDSLARFRSVPGEFGRKLREGIDWEQHCFRLDEKERCPFLNRDGLCELILDWGENSLCQICADHPRFRNFLTGRTEIGLGLCCEAAAELVLGQTRPMKLVILDDDGANQGQDAALLTLRRRLFTIAQNRTRTVEQRVEAILAACRISLTVDAAHWADFLMGLERLDPQWETCLQRLQEPQQPAPRWEIPLEQLLCYLLYRHLPGAVEDGNVQGRVAYCCLMWKLLRHMLRDDLMELARMYSAEIEYSDENMDAILAEIDGMLQQ